MGKYDRVTRGQTEELIDMIGGEKGLEVFLSGQVVTRMPEAPKFDPMWTVNPEDVPTESMNDFLNRFFYSMGRDHNMTQTLGRSNVFMRRYEEEIKLFPYGMDVCVATAAKIMERSSGITHEDVYVRLKLMGALCPVWLAPLLVMNPRFVSNRSRMKIAMDPMHIQRSSNRMFSIRLKGGQRWLNWDSLGRANCQPNNSWLFIRPLQI